MKLTRLAMSSSSTFRALVSRAKKTPATVESLNVSELPAASTVRDQPGDCDTQLRVEYSSINYKDAMVVTGNYPGLKLPMVAGLDIVGSVLSTSAPGLKEGQQVLINGFGIGTDHFGGFAERAAVCGRWCLPLQDAGDINPMDAARLGTAGYTALLCVDALAGVAKPEDGPVIVSGATGGVGSVAVALLSGIGYKVVAVTGKVEEEGQYLKNLGAEVILPRSEFSQEPKPLAKQNFAGAVDTVGGTILANILSQIKYGGCAAICGMAGGMALPTSVAPFILRGVTLFGIDSVFKDMDARKRVYSKYLPVLKENKTLEVINSGEQVVGLDQVPEIAQKMLEGQHKGRYMVKI